MGCSTMTLRAGKGWFAAVYGEEPAMVSTGLLATASSTTGEGASGRRGGPDDPGALVGTFVPGSSSNLR